MISPMRSRQPLNIKFFQHTFAKHVQEIVGLTMQMNVIGKAKAKEVVMKRMKCEREETADGKCELNDCTVCEIDENVEGLDEAIKDLCSAHRDHKDLAAGFLWLEECCNKGRENPLVLISNKRWIACVTKLAMELLRCTMEVYGATGSHDSEALNKLLAMVAYAFEDIVGKNTIVYKFNFETLELEDEKNLEMIQIKDFFADEVQDHHMLSSSLAYKASFGIKQIPNKIAAWDGRQNTALEIRSSKPDDRADCFLIRHPVDKTVSKQMKSEGIFDMSDNTIFEIQPKDLYLNNSNPNMKLVPDKSSVGRRLVLI